MLGALPGGRKQWRHPGSCDPLYKRGLQGFPRIFTLCDLVPLVAFTNFARDDGLDLRIPPTIGAVTGTIQCAFRYIT